MVVLGSGTYRPPRLSSTFFAGRCSVVVYSRTVEPPTGRYWRPAWYRSVGHFKILPTDDWLLSGGEGIQVVAKWLLSGGEGIQVIVSGSSKVAEVLRRSSSGGRRLGVEPPAVGWYPACRPHRRTTVFRGAHHSPLLHRLLKPFLMGPSGSQSLGSQ